MLCVCVCVCVGRAYALAMVAFPVLSVKKTFASLSTVVVTASAERGDAYAPRDIKAIHVNSLTNVKYQNPS